MTGDLHTSAWARRARRRFRYWRAIRPHIECLDRAAGVAVGACSVLSLQALWTGRVWTFAAITASVAVVVTASLMRWRWW